jgi:hypothetical protein
VRETTGSRRLSDIRDAFDRFSTDRMTSKSLLAELARDEEGPWLSYGKGGKQITDRQLSLIVNLADRTVQGFRYPDDFPVKITNINETTIVFHGSSPHAPEATYRQINGGIDRETGDAEATSDVTSWRESKASAIHSLNCRPTQF